MTTTVTGRLGGQYSLLAIEDNKYKVQGQTQQTSGIHTLFTGEYEIATRVLDYCQQHDGLAQQAIQDLFYKGDPTMMIQVVEAAKSDPTVKGRRRVAIVAEIETDVLEDEDAVTMTSQRMAAAFRMCGITVRAMNCGYTHQVEPQPPSVGLEYCVQQIEKAIKLYDSRRINTSLADEGLNAIKRLISEPQTDMSGHPFDLEEGTGNGQPG